MEILSELSLEFNNFTLSPLFYIISKFSFLTVSSPGWEPWVPFYPMTCELESKRESSDFLKKSEASVVLVLLHLCELYCMQLITSASNQTCLKWQRQTFRDLLAHRGVGWRETSPLHSIPTVLGKWTNLRQALSIHNYTVPHLLVSPS